MSTRAQQIMNELKTKSKIDYLEGAFRYYIDNEIGDKDLDEILTGNGIEMPNGFYDLPVRMKKKYFCHTHRTFIIAEDGSTDWYYENEVFNKNYFYLLADCARNSKKSTMELISHIEGIGDLSTLFLGLRYVKIKHMDEDIIPDIVKDYCAKTPSITTMHDLLMTVYSEWDGKKDIDKVKAAINKMLTESFNIKTSTFFELALHMELVLNLLQKKDANTLKIKFLILTPQELRDIDYYTDSARQKRIANNCKKELKEKETQKVVAKAKKFVEANRDWYENFSPNGYSALYNFLFEE